jgi:hypothetical protein
MLRDIQRCLARGRTGHRQPLHAVRAARRCARVADPTECSWLSCAVSARPSRPDEKMSGVSIGPGQPPPPCHVVFLVLPTAAGAHQVISPTGGDGRIRASPYRKPQACNFATSHHPPQSVVGRCKCKGRSLPLELGVTVVAEPASPRVAFRTTIAVMIPHRRESVRRIRMALYARGRCGRWRAMFHADEVSGMRI